MKIKNMHYQGTRCVRRIVLLIFFTCGENCLLNAQASEPFTLTASELHSNGEVLSVSSELIVNDDALTWHQTTESDFTIELSFPLSSLDSQQWDDTKKEGILEYTLSGSDHK